MTMENREPNLPCERCRKRRVKCDRGRPGCARCKKLSQPCPGYDRPRKFFDEGANLRRKFLSTKIQDQNSSVSSESNYSINQSSSDSGEDDTIRLLEAGTISSPSGDGLMDDMVSHGRDTPDEVFISYQTTPFSATHTTNEDLSISDFDAEFFDIDPEAYYAEGNNCCGFIPNLPMIDDINDPQGPTISWANHITLENFSQFMLNPPGETSDMTESVSDSSHEPEHEVAYLIRHFAEFISPWLDTFDIEKYFGHVVPVKALRSTLLKNSLAAIAAKQFGKMKRESWPSSDRSNRSMLHMYDDESDVDWFYKAASFYDKAIGHMRISLQVLGNGSLRTAEQNGSMSADSHSSAGRSTAASSPSKRLRQEKNSPPQSTTDELLAAVSIFLLYESLDNRQVEILQHMKGAQYLLTVDLNQQYPKSLGSVGYNLPLNIDTTKAWQASFWNFACTDYIISYIEQSKTRLDLEDQRLWTAAGLPIRDVNGLQFPNSLYKEDSPKQMTATIACRTLIWIVLKTMNFVAAEKEQDRAISITATDTSESPSESTLGPESWHQIRQHLEDWYARLPDTFEPCMRISKPQSHQLSGRRSPMHSVSNDTETSSITQIPFPELFYSNSMGATAILLYHFTQILLLLHKPIGHINSRSHSQFVTKRLNAYRQVSNQIDHHAREICAIALGRPDPSVRIHMLQPLYLAGLCLEAHEQKIILADLLVSIQKDTGCSTEWRVTQLKEEWGWEDIYQGST